MSRLAIFSNGPSNSVNDLKEYYAEQGINLVKVKHMNSVFRGRQGDLLINYGSSTLRPERIGEATLLNTPTSITSAANKLLAFQKMNECDVKTVQWTQDGAVAQIWVGQGEMTYARTILSGHSGEGIVVGTLNQEEEGLGGVEVVSNLPEARLYTKAISGQRREFRIHIMKGKIIYVQQKRRRDGYRENENYSNVVRNHHTGWIYATQSVEPCEEAKQEALKAVQALGLDFGAVDVITRRGEAWVLEVNTAPGMSGTTLKVYANNFKRIFDGLEIEGTSLDDLYQPSNQTSSNSEELSSTDDGDESRRDSESATETSSETEEVEELPTTEEPANSSETTLINEGVYKLHYRDFETVGSYYSDDECFWILGWDVQIPVGDVNVGELLCVLD